MPPMREQAIARLHHDHAFMADLVRRIEACCTQDWNAADCDGCMASRHLVCHGSIDDLIRSLVEVTLKHNVIESILMKECAPRTHRIAHERANSDLTERMNRIRVVLSGDGNCVVAIKDINSVLRALESHAEDFDSPLEGYLVIPSKK